MTMKNMKTGLVPAIALAFALSTPAFAAGSHKGGHDYSQIGEPGKASEVSRTVEVVMGDIYFEPEEIAVLKGETIRFVVRNDGAIVHEFNIGTPDMHLAHQEEMQMMVDHGVILGDRLDRAAMKMKMPDGSTMEHDDPNTLLLEPGETAEIIWKFSEPLQLEFACNVPGHYDAGMAGIFQFVSKLAQN